MSQPRYHLCVEALQRVPRLAEHGTRLLDQCRAMLGRHQPHIREHLEEMPDVRDWTWTDA